MYDVDDLRQQLIRLDQVDRADGELTTIGVRDRHGVYACLQAVDILAYRLESVGSVPIVAVRSCSAINGHSNPPVIATIAGNVVQAADEGRQAVRVANGEAGYSFTAIDICHRHTVGAGRQVHRRRTDGIGIFLAGTPGEVVGAGAAAGAHRSPSGHITGTGSIDDIVDRYSHLSGLADRYRPEGCRTAFRVGNRYVVISGAQAIRVFYIRGIIPVVGIGRRAANYSQLDTTVGLAIATGINTHPTCHQRHGGLANRHAGGGSTIMIVRYRHRVQDASAQACSQSTGLPIAPQVAVGRYAASSEYPGRTVMASVAGFIGSQNDFRDDIGWFVNIDKYHSLATASIRNCD